MRLHDAARALFRVEWIFKCKAFNHFSIKQSSEKRTTHSWDVSIRNAIAGIGRVNKRRKAGGYYLSSTELQEILAEAYDQALDNAALEAFGGIYDAIAPANMVNRVSLVKQALELISFI